MKLLNMGWNPPVSLNDSLERTVKWMINNPNWL
jgi:dTDP-D-glucose 4,6-dehydratase